MVVLLLWSANRIVRLSGSLALYVQYEYGISICLDKWYSRADFRLPLQRLRVFFSEKEDRNHKNICISLLMISFTLPTYPY